VHSCRQRTATCDLAAALADLPPLGPWITDAAVEHRVEVERHLDDRPSASRLALRQSM